MAGTKLNVFAEDLDSANKANENYICLLKRKHIVKKEKTLKTSK